MKYYLFFIFVFLSFVFIENHFKFKYSYCSVYPDNGTYKLYNDYVECIKNPSNRKGLLRRILSYKESECFIMMDDKGMFNTDYHRCYDKTIK